MYITIDKILEIKEIDGLKLVAGKQGSDNIISNVNILDNPDTFDWLIAGDLLLTTGYIFKDDVLFQKKLIQELFERNCAGLGVKVKRYFEQVPEIMLNEADRLGFPIIEIPFKYSLSDISNVVTSHVYGNMDSILQKGIYLHDTLTKVALRGGEIGEIIESVVSIINNPVILLDSKFRLLAARDHQENSFKLAEHFSLVYQEPVFSEDFTAVLPTNPDEFKKSIKLNYSDSNEEIIFRVVPVIGIRVTYGYLVVAETVSKMKRIDYMALEHAATVIAMERIKEKEVEAVKHRIRGDFFDDLLANNIHSVNGLNSIAEIHGLDPKKKYYCMITKLRGTDIHGYEAGWGNVSEYSTLKDKICRIIDKNVREGGRIITSITRRNMIISFIQDKVIAERTQRNISLEIAYGILETLEAEIRGIEVEIGIGKVYEILSISKSFNEAQDSFDMGSKLGREKVVHYENHMIVNLLRGDNSSDKLMDFYNNTVGKLVEYDKENGTNLIETMEAYFRQNGNISEAAKELFVHRNTLIYRIDKIKMILDSDLKDSEELLEIQLGFKIRNMLKPNEK